MTEVSEKNLSLIEALDLSTIERKIQNVKLIVNEVLEETLGVKELQEAVWPIGSPIGDLSRKWDLEIVELA